MKSTTTMSKFSPFRFTSFDDKGWFEGCITKVVKDHLGPDFVEDISGEEYFVDFLRDAPEPTGEEGEDEKDLEAPQVYEMVLFIVYLLSHCS